MSNVEVGQDAPETIDLRVIPVDFRDDKEDEPQKDGYVKARNQGVRLNVDLLQAVQAPNAVQHSVWEFVELRDEGLDGFGVITTVLKTLDNGQGHL